MRNVAATALWVLACASCVHTRSPQDEGVDGVTAMLEWTQALYPNDSERRLVDETWWIGPGPRRDLERLRVPRSALPRSLESHAETLRTPDATQALKRCAVHRFGPLILRQSEDADVRDVADALEDEPTANNEPHVAANDIALLEKAMRPDDPYGRIVRRQRVHPSIEEIGAWVVLSGFNERHPRPSLCDIVSPDMRAPVLRDARAVLTLAPLYALSAGADPDEVRAIAGECFEALGIAQHNVVPAVDCTIPQ